MESRRLEAYVSLLVDLHVGHFYCSGARYLHWLQLLHRLDCLHCFQFVQMLKVVEVFNSFKLYIYIYTASLPALRACQNLKSILTCPPARLHLLRALAKWARPWLSMSGTGLAPPLISAVTWSSRNFGLPLHIVLYIDLPKIPQQPQKCQWIKCEVPLPPIALVWFPTLWQFGQYSLLPRTVLPPATKNKHVFASHNLTP